MDPRPSLLAAFTASAWLALAPTPIQAGDGGTAAPGAAPQRFEEIPATTETLRQLRNGGFVLYLRHGMTDNQQADRVPTVDLSDCSTQRPLTEEGRLMAGKVGEAIRRSRIPIGEIRSSPLCRAVGSARAAFPTQAFVVDQDLMYTANLTASQKAPIIANTRHLLSTPVPTGTNRLLLAHAPNLMDLIGYFPKEATLVIFRPGGEGRFDYVASIPPGLWPELQGTGRAR